MAKLKQAHGNWVVGEQFWDREEDLELFVERIEEGANVLLVAQRRLGKTSLMREATRRLGDRYVCVFVDLQKAHSAPDAIVELSLAVRKYKTLWAKTKNVFANVLERITETVEQVNLGDLGVTLRAGLNAGNWEEKGNQVFGILAASDRPVVLMVDEVPILVSRLLKGDDFTMTPKRRQQTDEFMSWVRKNSLEHQGKVSMVLSGSIGLEPILRQARLSATVNHFKAFELKPWDESVAMGCIEALANQYGVELEDGAAAAMVSKLGCCIPHHVQMFFDHVYTTCRRREKMSFSATEVDEVYEREMLSIRGHAELTHYEERLEMVLGKEVFALALDMLTEAAVTGRLTKEACLALQKEYEFEGRDFAEVQREVLWVLEHDGYLRAGSDGYVFVSPLLRDWWKARYGFAFTPVLQRRSR